MVDLRISVSGRDSDAESLWDWLRAEPEFRRHLRLDQASAPEGAMGALVEVIVGVSSSGAATALAKAMQVWLVQRRADVMVKISGPRGEEIVLDAKRILDAEHLLDTLSGWTRDVPPASPVGDQEDGQ